MLPLDIKQKSLDLRERFLENNSIVSNYVMLKVDPAGSEHFFASQHSTFYKKDCSFVEKIIHILKDASIFVLPASAL
jgi:hypothetical protein